MEFHDMDVILYFRRSWICISYRGSVEIAFLYVGAWNSYFSDYFLAGILTMIMVRTLRRDIARYNADEGPDETIEETGWKLVHGDVFRPPRYSRLFAAVIGSGIQIFFMALITICMYH